ncbi:efflux RND transporter periplasmic adaptor subunit [Paenibacillus rigui]|uniref:Efflux transporter periplasmic adaptor subunit n=1 Tax=Paenibacillus rigui TaxID=554312 RepID=A0A229UJD0_9BACL|nr:efflux RND transporter periplasmic adaptor subunit [Paenibacillus rigui]OXM83461.1 efflux transporter periplasmic adaptor subunit [Paenibacillus rigui]
MRTKKKTWIPAILSLVVITALSGCGGTAAPKAAAAELPVKAIKIGQSSGSGLSGKVIPDQEVKIVAKTSGKVSEMKANEGDMVKKGDVIIQLETDDLTQQVKQAEAGVIAAQAKLADTQAGARSQEIQGLESAVQQAQGAADQAKASADSSKASFDLAQKTYNKLRNLYDTNASVTKEDMDKGTTEYEKAQAAYQSALALQQSAAAQVSAAKSKLDLARSGATGNTIEALQADVNRLNASLELANNALTNATIVAPMDGVIVKKSISVGEMAQPGVALVTLVKMDQVQIELSVPDTLIGSLKAGTDVDVKVSNVPDKTFPGKINFVSPVSNTNTSTFPVKVTAANPDGLLLAGMTAEVHLKDSKQGGLEIPKSAIVKKDNKTIVYIVQDQTAKAVEVSVEDKNADWAYMKDNASIKSGQQLIINPSEALTDGSKVKVE